MDVRFVDNQLTLTDVPLIFSILLNDYAGHLVVDLSMDSLNSMEVYYFKYWHKIFSFRLKNNNILKMQNDEMARIEYDSAGRLANQNAIYLLGSFTPVVISCNIESSDLGRVVQRSKIILGKKSNAGCFNNELKMYLSQFVKKSSKLVLSDKKMIETNLRREAHYLMCASGCFVPKVIQDDVELVSEWTINMCQLGNRRPLGTVSDTIINAEVHLL